MVMAAITVLATAGAPLHFEEITSRAVAAGLYDGKCANPAVSMESALTKALKGGETRFTRVGRGLYAAA
jgi:hypothetical protein